MRKTLRNITIVLVGVNSFFSCQNPQEESSEIRLPVVSDSLVVIHKEIDVDTNWREIDFIKTGIIEQMAYADTTNFMHKNIYPCAKCFLRPEVADALLKANKLAKQSGYQLVLFDCYRPVKFQQVMYDIVQNPDYVALPSKGSMHNKGLAVDIGLANMEGELLDFDTEFDDFSERSHIFYEGVSEVGAANRKALRNIMTQAGFSLYIKEWWHFSFPNVKYSVDDFIWTCN